MCQVNYYGLLDELREAVEELERAIDKGSVDRIQEAAQKVEDISYNIRSGRNV